MSDRELVIQRRLSHILRIAKRRIAVFHDRSVAVALWAPIGELAPDAIGQAILYLQSISIAGSIYLKAYGKPSNDWDSWTPVISFPF